MPAGTFRASDASFFHSYSLWEPAGKAVLSFSDAAGKALYTRAWDAGRTAMPLIRDKWVSCATRSPVGQARWASERRAGHSGGLGLVLTARS